MKLHDIITFGKKNRTESKQEAQKETDRNIKLWCIKFRLYSVNFYSTDHEIGQLRGELINGQGYTTLFNQLISNAIRQIEAGNENVRNVFEAPATYQTGVLYKAVVLTKNSSDAIITSVKHALREKNRDYLKDELQTFIQGYKEYGGTRYVYVGCSADNLGKMFCYGLESVTQVDRIGNIPLQHLPSHDPYIEYGGFNFTLSRNLTQPNHASLDRLISDIYSNSLSNYSRVAER